MGADSLTSNHGVIVRAMQSEPFQSRVKKSPQAGLSPCPCGSEKSYSTCCGPWHLGIGAGLHAPTPEALMRSRYSAYVLGLITYLLETWHASSSPGALDLPPVKWLGLEVRHAVASGDAGVVEFVARCRDAGKAQRMHETSRFVREAGRWWYVDADLAAP